MIVGFDDRHDAASPNPLMRRSYDISALRPKPLRSSARLWRRPTRLGESDRQEAVVVVESVLSVVNRQVERHCSPALTDNTTAHLIDDVLRLRRELSIHGRKASDAPDRRAGAICQQFSMASGPFF